MSEEEITRRGPGRPPKVVTESELAAAVTSAGPVAPVSSLTPPDVNAELEALRAEVARMRAEKEEASAVQSTEAPKSGKFVIHMVRDGLQILGKMTFQGQEFEFDTNEQNYKDTQDKNGWSFLELRRDAAAQEALFGYEFFREGAWTGKSYADIKYETLKRLASKGEDSTITARELDQLDQLDKKRRRKLDPLPPVSMGQSVRRL